MLQFFVCAPMVSYVAFILSLFSISSSFVVSGRPCLVIVAFHGYFYKCQLCKASLLSSLSSLMTNSLSVVTRAFLNALTLRCKAAHVFFFSKKYQRICHISR